MSTRWVVFGLLCAASSPAAGQQSPVRDLIASARRLVSATQLDSAVVLLERAVDFSAGGTTGERAQASVLLGIARYYQGLDSLTAAAFRAALALDSTLQVGGLAQIDTALARVFDAERNRRVAHSAARAAAENPHYCIRGCRDGEQSPTLRDIPRFVVLDSGPDFMNTRAVVVVRLVVSAEGVPEAESIRVTSSTMSRLNNQVVDAVRAAHFRPALAGGTPVRALVELSFGFRAEGMNGITYSIQGP